MKNQLVKIIILFAILLALLAIIYKINNPADIDEDILDGDIFDSDTDFDYLYEDVVDGEKIDFKNKTTQISDDFTKVESQGKTFNIQGFEGEFKTMETLYREDSIDGIVVLLNRDGIVYYGKYNGTTETIQLNKIESDIKFIHLSKTKILTNEIGSAVVLIPEDEESTYAIRDIENVIIESFSFYNEEEYVREYNLLFTDGGKWKAIFKKQKLVGKEQEYTDENEFIFNENYEFSNSSGYLAGKGTYSIDVENSLIILNYNSGKKQEFEVVRIDNEESYDTYLVLKENDGYDIYYQKEL